MGSPELNQLLEEAAQRCDDVAAGADASTNAAAAVVAHATAIGTLASHDADALHQEMTQAIEAIHHARDQAAQATATATELLHGLPTRVEHAQTEIKGLLQAAHDDLQHLQEARQRLLQGLQASSDQAEASFQALDTGIRDLATRLDQHVHDAEAHLLELQNAVKAAQSHLQDEEQNVHKAIAALSKSATDRTAAMTAAVSFALTSIAEQVVALCNGAIDSHNEMATAVRHGYTDETPGGGQPAETWLSRAAKPLHDGFAELAQFPDQVKDAVRGPLDTILEKGEKAITALGNITESVQRATREDH